MKSIHILEQSEKRGLLRSGMRIVEATSGNTGLVFFRKLAWDLADEVFDAGHYLIFRKGKEEQRGAPNVIRDD